MLTTNLLDSIPSPNFRDPKKLEDMIDYALYLAYRDCGVLTEKTCKSEYGINRRRLRIIFNLIHSEGVTVSELAQLADLDLSQTSRTISTMMREGYLRRLSNPNNARYAQIHLTEKGRQLYYDIFEHYKGLNQSLLRSFTEDELTTLETLLVKLRKNAMNLGQFS